MTVWRFKKKLIDLVESSIKKGNKPQTTVSKVKAFIKDNSQNLKYTDEVAVWKHQHDKYEAYRVVFENYNKGLYQFINSSIKISVADIRKMHKNNEKFYVVVKGDNTGIDSKDLRYSVSELDFNALQLIIDNGK